MKLFRSILSVAFSALVLVSSTSFMVGIHFCGGAVQDVSLFSQADCCEKKPACHRHMKGPCCEDETVIHKGEELKGAVAQIYLMVPAAVDTVLPGVLISEVIPSVPLPGIKYYNYDPPLRSCDLTVEYQVFLV